MTMSNNLIYIESGVAAPTVDSVNFGLIYNYYAVEYGLIKTGWRLPVDADWTTLKNNVPNGYDLVATGTTYWNHGNGTNGTGFGARGGGYRRSSDGTFQELKDDVHYWHSNGFSTNKAYSQIVNDILNISPGWNAKSAGNVIRLIKNSTTLLEGTSGYYYANDGQVFPTIAIGDGSGNNIQEWLAVPLADTKYTDLTTIPEVTDNVAWTNLTTGALCAYNNTWSNV